MRLKKGESGKTCLRSRRKKVKQWMSPHTGQQVSALAEDGGQGCPRNTCASQVQSLEDTSPLHPIPKHPLPSAPSLEQDQRPPSSRTCLQVLIASLSGLLLQREHRDSTECSHPELPESQLRLEAQSPPRVLPAGSHEHPMAQRRLPPLTLPVLPTKATRGEPAPGALCPKR